MRQLMGNIEKSTIDKSADIEEIGDYINLALAVRNSLRKEKQFNLADEIRNRLIACGFTIEDTPEGTKWVYKK